MENTEGNIKQRLNDFLICKKIGQRTFERMAKLSNGYVNNIKSSIGSDKLQSIIYAFPELNIIWLLTGEGEMIKGSEINIVNEPAVEYCKNIDYKEKYLEVLERYFVINEDYRSLVSKKKNGQSNHTQSALDVNA